MGRETSSKAAAATAGPLPNTRIRTEASLHLQHLQQAMQFLHQPIQPHLALQLYKVITLGADSHDLLRSMEPELKKGIQP